MSTNPFNIQSHSLPIEMIIDRKAELEMLVRTVKNRGENVLLLGEYGIGKTCLLRKFRSCLEADLTNRSFEIIEIETRQINSDSSDFMERILSALFKLVWSKISERPFSDLIFGSVKEEDVQNIGIPGIKALIGFYNHFRSNSFSHEHRLANTIGGSLVVKGERQEQFSSNFRQDGLKPWEYNELIGEVLRIYRNRSDSKVLIFADEANHIHPDLQIDIFRYNLDSFLREDVQFIFTAKDSVLEKVPHLSNAFPNVLQIKGFDSKGLLCDLVSQYCQRTDMVFNSNSIDRIWDLTDGHPSKINKLCRASFDSAENDKSATVTADHVFQAALSLGKFDFR